MKTRMVEERIGEHLGDIDWSYDFLGHASLNPDYAIRAKEMLKAIESGLKVGESWQATTDGGWPKFGWHPVVLVGMYDGWPYWKPTPSVLMVGPLGVEWHSWCSLSGAEKV